MAGPDGLWCSSCQRHAPFSLLDDDNQKFRHSTRTESGHIIEKYNTGRISFYEWLLVIENPDPPTPIPLTVACMPGRFYARGQEERVCVYGLYPYCYPSIPDPCPEISWSKKESPTKSQIASVVHALSKLANVRRINFMPAAIVVELVSDDGHEYPRNYYHHASDSFFNSTRDQTREREDPSQYPAGLLPQDATNYIHEPEWGMFSPGMRVSTAPAADSRPMISGIFLRKGDTQCITVASHAFPDTQEVFHPAPHGDKIGDIIKRHPELDTAMVQLTPANSHRFTNNTYFQAEPPRRLALSSDITPGTWFEADGMNTGLLSFLCLGKALEKPARPITDIPADEWKQSTFFNIFGTRSPQIMEGIYGAPIVEAGTGLVAGLLHSANGVWAECAALDDLVAERWGSRLG